VGMVGMVVVVALGSDPPDFGMRGRGEGRGVSMKYYYIYNVWEDDKWNTFQSGDVSEIHGFVYN